VSKLVEHCPFRQSDFHSRLPSFVNDILRTDLLSNLCLRSVSVLDSVPDSAIGNAMQRYEYYGTASLRSALGSTNDYVGTRNRRSSRSASLLCGGRDSEWRRCLPHCLSVSQVLTSDHQSVERPSWPAGVVGRISPRSDPFPRSPG
jgi:hypothetical protein